MYNENKNIIDDTVFGLITILKSDLFTGNDRKPIKRTLRLIRDRVNAERLAIEEDDDLHQHVLLQAAIDSINEELADLQDPTF